MSKEKLPAESKDFKKPSLEQLDVLRERISQIPDISSELEMIISQIEHIQHEAATGDDSPRKYQFLEELLESLNNSLKKIPDSVEM